MPSVNGHINLRMFNSKFKYVPNIIGNLKRIPSFFLELRERGVSTFLSLSSCMQDLYIPGSVGQVSFLQFSTMLE